MLQISLVYRWRYPNNGNPNAISSIKYISDENKVKLKDVEKLMLELSNNVAELTAILRCQIIKGNNIILPIHLYTDYLIVKISSMNGMKI